MCLTTRQTEAKIATKRIPIFKILTVKAGEGVSPIQYKYYVPQKEYRSKIKAIHRITCAGNKYVDVEHALHAHTSLSAARCSWLHNGSTKIIEGYIPKGALYYAEGGEIAANRMILYNKARTPYGKSVTKWYEK